MPAHFSPGQADAVASVAPSGEKATLSTMKPWPSRVRSDSPVVAFHNLIVESTDPQAQEEPYSGERESDFRQVDCQQNTYRCLHKGPQATADDDEPAVGVQHGHTPRRLSWTQGGGHQMFVFRTPAHTQTMSGCWAAMAMRVGAQVGTEPCGARSIRA